MRAQAAMLPDGRRLHLQDGPIDLVIEVFGAPVTIRAAYAAAGARFGTILDELCHELPLLRRPVRPGTPMPRGVVARRMRAAVEPFAAGTFITPMAAVAGAVAEEVLAAMTAAAPLARAYVNNGGDIAIHIAPGEHFRTGLVDRPDAPGLFGTVTIRSRDGIGGIATSGWRGRSFSRGIADAVTILARTAAAADAAATLVANAVDLPDHPAIRRAPAREVQTDSDLGDILVTRAVERLARGEIAEAFARGWDVAEELIREGLIEAAAMHLQGETVVAGSSAGPLSRRDTDRVKDAAYPKNLAAQAARNRQSSQPESLAPQPIHRPPDAGMAVASGARSPRAHRAPVEARLPRSPHSMGGSSRPRHAEEARHAPSRSTPGVRAYFETRPAGAPQHDERGYSYSRSGFPDDEIWSSGPGSEALAPDVMRSESPRAQDEPACLKGRLPPPPLHKRRRRWFEFWRSVA